MASIEGLKALTSLTSEANKTIQDQNQEMANQEAAKTAAGLFQQGDIKGAIGTLVRANPAWAEQIVKNPSAISPEFAGQEAFEKAKGMGEGSWPTEEKKINLQGEWDVKKAQIMAQHQRDKDAQDAAKERRLTIQNERGLIQRYQSQYNSIAKGIEERINSLGGLDNFIKLSTENPIAASQLGVQVAKALGEVGNLSESDVTRYVQNKAIANKVAQEVVALQNGTLLPENALYLQDALQAIAGIAADRQNFLKNKYAEQVAANFDVPREYAAWKLGFGPRPEGMTEGATSEQARQTTTTKSETKPAPKKEAPKTLAYSDPEKEKRYQEWKSSQSKGRTGSW